MSFLAGRLAATEGAFFSQSSKQAIVRLKEKLNDSPSSSSEYPQNPNSEANSDVLPEILQHTPVKGALSGSSEQTASFSPLPSSLVASLTPSSTTDQRYISQSDVVNASGPMSFLPSVPHTSFGPNRWRPAGEPVEILHSTANEARYENGPTIDDAKAKALVEGYAAVLKAFLVATALVVGGATVAAGVAVSKLDIHSIEDIRIKGSQFMQYHAENIQQRVSPWKQWAQEKSKDWNMKNEKRSTISAPFVEAFGLQQILRENDKQNVEKR